MTISARDALDLLDWKRRVFGIYAGTRTADNPLAGWRMWVNAREHLFRKHPQSPIPAPTRANWTGDYYDYDPGFRVVAEVVDAEPERYEIPTSGTETMKFFRIATAVFPLGGRHVTLDIYWLDAYAGGIFVPFRDATSGKTTYGAGRYLLDTVKGSDLGTVDGKLVFDFNFAYNPSCAYDPRWVCPLAPPPNRLEVAIEAGEKTPAS